MTEVILKKIKRDISFRERIGRMLEPFRFDLENLYWFINIFPCTLVFGNKVDCTCLPQVLYKFKLLFIAFGMYFFDKGRLQQTALSETLSG